MADLSGFIYGSEFTAKEIETFVRMMMARHDGKEPVDYYHLIEDMQEAVGRQGLERN